MIRGLIAVAALVAAQGLALTGTASAEASTVRVERGQLIFQAAQGHTNRLTISHDGRAFVLTDAIAMTPGPGCERLTSSQVSCAASTITVATIDLGDGDDTASNTTCADNMTIFGSADSDTLHGGCGPDHLYGGDGPDYLHGGSGGDLLKGGPGVDELYGDTGTDYLDGGTGNDIIDGSDGMRDRVEYTDSTVPVKVTLAVWPATGTGTTRYVNGNGGVVIETDTISRVQDVRGGEGNDTLNGDSQFNDLVGGPGADTMYGNGGNDNLSGYDGNDHLWGGDGDDALYGGDGDDDLHGEGHDFSSIDLGDFCFAGGQAGDTVETCKP